MGPDAQPRDRSARAAPGADLGRDARGARAPSRPGEADPARCLRQGGPAGRKVEPVSAWVFIVDERLSWARSSGDAVNVHLRLPGAELAAGAVGVELVSAGSRLRTTAEVTVGDGAVEVVLDVPRREL